MIFFPSDHLIEKTKQFNKELNFNTKYLDDDNIFIFGIKPQYSSSQYGYFLTKKTSKGINIVTKFIEKGEKEHEMALGISQRSGAVVEPMLSIQWFVDTKPLAEPDITR